MSVFPLRMLLSKLMKLISGPSAAFYTLAGSQGTLLSRWLEPCQPNATRTSPARTYCLSACSMITGPSSDG